MVDAVSIGKIAKGIAIFIGIGNGDTTSDALWLAKKISTLRLFKGTNDKMDLSIQDIQGEIIIISQFTLYCDCSKGLRPDCTQAMAPKEAQELYRVFIDLVTKETGIIPKTGKFGASMTIEMSQDGPFNLFIESP